MPIQWATPKWEYTPEPFPDHIPKGHKVVRLSDIDPIEKWLMANNHQQVYCVINDVRNIERYTHVLLGLTPNVILPKELEEYRNDS